MEQQSTTDKCPIFKENSWPISDPYFYHCVSVYISVMLLDIVVADE